MDESIEWRHLLDDLHMLEEQRGREKGDRRRKKGKKGQGNNFVAKDQGVKGGLHDHSTRYTWTFSNCHLSYDPARAVFDGME